MSAVESLEPRVVLSVTGTPPSVPSDTSRDAPIAHDDGPYRGVHGKSLQGTVPSLLLNDIRTSLVITSGGMLTTLPSTPGGSSVTYQATDSYGDTASATATVISTNLPPSRDVASFPFAVVALDAATIAPSPTRPGCD